MFIPKKQVTLVSPLPNLQHRTRGGQYYQTNEYGRVKAHPWDEAELRQSGFVSEEEYDALQPQERVHNLPETDNLPQEASAVDAAAS